MFDTLISRFNEIPLRQGLVLEPDQFCELTGLPGWRYDLGKPQRRGTQACRRFRILAPLWDCPGTRILTLWGHAQVIDGFKVSLPAVIHGSNLHLILSQADIDRALQKVTALINQVADFNPEAVDLYFTRVDLALQYSPPGIPPSAFFASLRNCRHPAIRGETISYRIDDQPSGPCWNGSEVTIRAYDKSLKHTGRAGNVTRIETELRGGILKRLLGNAYGGYPNRLDFCRGYQVYRELLHQFEPIRRLACADSIGLKEYAAILAAHCENQGLLLPDGSRPLELYRQSFSAPAFNGFRKLVSAAQLSMNGISFAELLPEQWPPRHLVFDAEALPEQHTNPTPAQP